MTRLFVDAHCFDYPSYEGVNTYIRGLYTTLIKIAKDITFVFASAHPDKLKGIFGDHPNVEYVRLHHSNRFIRLLYEYPRLTKKLRIDAAHFQYVAPFFKNCTTIITIHDILFKDYPEFFPKFYRLSKGMMFRRSAHAADILLTVSDYSRRRLALHYNIAASEILVTPNAAQTELYSSSDISEQTSPHNKEFGRYILNVSRLEPRKNLTSMLKCYVELRLWEKGYEMVMIGRDSLPVPEMADMMKKLPEEIRKHIHILSNQSYDEMRDWYAGASLFIYPSKAEGFGIPPIEAGAMGIPVICSDSTAMAEFSFFGRNLIDISDIDLLKQRIIDNLEHRDEAMLADIRKSILSTYSWTTSARIFLNALRKI